MWAMARRRVSIPFRGSIRPTKRIIRHVGIHGQLFFGLGGRNRAKALQVYPRRDDPDAGGIRTVVLDQLFLLQGSGSDDSVGKVDDFRLRL